LLRAAEGAPSTRIAADVGVSATTVKNWRERFEQDGLKGLGVVRAGRGRKPQIGDEKVAEIVRATLHDKPEGETHWSCRSMAAAQGVSPATVQRIWSARGRARLAGPHRANRGWRLCQSWRLRPRGWRDPDFGVTVARSGPRTGCWCALARLTFATSQGAR
jgi:DNA-binding transcriptional regulator YhcF (GntR family)